MLNTYAKVILKTDHYQREKNTMGICPLNNKKQAVTYVFILFAVGFLFVFSKTDRVTSCFLNSIFVHQLLFPFSFK